MVLDLNVAQAMRFRRTAEAGGACGSSRSSPAGVVARHSRAMANSIQGPIRQMRQQVPDVATAVAPVRATKPVFFQNLGNLSFRKNSLLTFFWEFGRLDRCGVGVMPYDSWC